MKATTLPADSDTPELRAPPSPGTPVLAMTRTGTEASGRASNSRSVLARSAGLRSTTITISAGTHDWCATESMADRRLLHRSSDRVQMTTDTEALVTNLATAWLGRRL